MPTRKKIVSLSAKKAREYFLSQECYLGFELPFYFDFSKILKKAIEIYDREGSLSNVWKMNPRRYDDVNRIILDNKDGKSAWRPFSLIHPILYVNLVYTITEDDAWQQIQAHFKKALTKHLKCTSVPIVVENERNNRASMKKEQILEWWEEMEQESFKVSLEFPYMVKTDIADCYNSIYTHSIEWALHTRAVSKQVWLGNGNKNAVKLGHSIDDAIQKMQSGQTHGIPQGSVLMDFVAEIILAAIDVELVKRLKEKKILGYKIIRFRDDYRIFTKDKNDGVIILKELGDVLRIYCLNLNSKKTVVADDVIRGSLKNDKWELINSSLHLSLVRFMDLNDGLIGRAGYSFQKLMLQIYEYSLRNANAGQLKRILSILYRLIPDDLDVSESHILLSIVANIAQANPKACPHCSAIISKLLPMHSASAKKRYLQGISSRFKNIPNSDFFNIWMQRITLPLGMSNKNKLTMCSVVVDSREVKNIWNNKWLQDDIVTEMESCDIIKRDEVNHLASEIQQFEIDAFSIDDY